VVVATEAAPVTEHSTVGVTFTQLERFESTLHQLEHAAIPESMDPAVRQLEIDAARAVALELREELTQLAGGRYVCTEHHPYDRDTFAGPEGARVIHPAAEDVGECAEGCCDRYRCPRCGTVWHQELPQ
jgi:hypothetical protein